MTRQFIQENFSAFYEQHRLEPLALARREFGFGFEDKIDFRHKNFASAQELQQYLVREAPLYVSYSTAYYEFPSLKPMEKKNLQKQDLVFDLDVSPLAPESHAHNSVLCIECISAVQRESARLVEDFLVKDFGFSKGEMAFNFSGSKGFHIHCREDAVQQLSKDARAQLAHYVSATGISWARYAEQEERYYKLYPSAQSKGWDAKVFARVLRFVEGMSEESLRATGFTKPSIVKFLANKDAIVERVRKGQWQSLFGLERKLEEIVDAAIAQGRVIIDAPVTFDSARLIRLPDSLHGGTALAARSFTSFDSFSVGKDAVAFSKGLKSVVPSITTSFSLSDQTFAVEEGKATELPLAAALLLVCKGKASLA